MIKDVLTNDAPELKQVCTPISVDDAKGLVTDLYETAFAYKKGRVISAGLAAPQIGVCRRVFVFRDTSKTMKFKVAINPRVIRWDKPVLTRKEGCLSYPGIDVNVPRHKSIKVEYTNECGVLVREYLKGFEARVFQHELDHLDGICRVGDAWREKQQGEG